METEKIFKTKTGFCHVLADKIVLTTDGVVGNLSKISARKHVIALLIFYGIISFGLFYLAFRTYQNGMYFHSAISGLIGLYLIYGIARSWNNSATRVIERKKIKKTRFKKALKGISRARFEVFFKDENGSIKKRLIMLPGSLSDGSNETQKAIQIMKEVALIK